MRSIVFRVSRFAIALILFFSPLPLSTAQQNTDCNIRVTLLQVNDVYQFTPVDQGTRGGIGRVLTLRKSIQKENPNFFRNVLCHSLAWHV